MYDRKAVKLPIPDGEQRKHPLLRALDTAADMGMNSSDVARALDVTPQTLWIWKARAKKQRNFLMPAEQVPALSRVTGVAPYYFRPDLWPTTAWRFELP